jgi:Bacteriophage tail sheath protein
VGLAVDTVAGVPGVYRDAAARAAGFPRARTDVAGFVGVAGPNRVGEAVRVDDWRSYEQVYLRDDRGRTLAPPAGARLAECVRAFFANGGSRCWIVNVADTIDAMTPDALLDTMLGTLEPTGLEALLRVREVAIVGLPELDAWIPSTDTSVVDEPVAGNDRFQCCPALRELPPFVDASMAAVAPLYQPAQLIFAQRYLIERCGRVKWRAFAIVSPPAGLSPAQALAWRDAITRNLADADAGAMYWPWVRAQDKPGASVELRPPLGYVAGIYARRDLARGPHSPPANESLTAVIGVETEIADAVHGATYARGLNVLRPFANVGVQIWGARTLRWAADDPDRSALGWVNVRRCLSAIERTADLIGQGAVFEPNVALTWFALTQALTGYLLDVHRAGGLAGATPAESFAIRCDSSVNSPSGIRRGELVCVVAVAIAAPAEFIVFRLGRADGVIEIQETD